MNEFVIFTDSSADLSQELAQEMDVRVVPLSFTIEGKTYHDYPDQRDMKLADFYDLLRAGKQSSTAAVNIADYLEGFTPVLQAGQDILCSVLSSGLSSSYQNACLAAQELVQEFPERKVLVVDSLSASMGHALFLWNLIEQKRAGKTIEEVRDWGEANRLNVCHWFTVDDLHFLKRGGRVSAATAVVGTMLNIKPVLHVDNEGRLISMSKARGRQAALAALVDKMAETGINPAEQTLFISHSDCLEDAERVAEMTKTRLGVRDVKISFIGSIIGSHTGPGTIAYFFMGTPR